MATLSVPSASAVERRPLSNHGMPKVHRVTSPQRRPHRFPALKSPSPSTMSGPASPRSLNPMSPPMSARSFGTFIDSEPSTPAYSPRLDFEWDNSNLVLLRPMSSSSEPSSPTEPVWDMIAPTKTPEDVLSPFTTKRQDHTVATRRQPTVTRLAAPPVKKIKPSKPSQDTESHNWIKVSDLRPKDDEYPKDEDDGYVKAQAVQPTGSSSAPFGKLASKMKYMLKRRSTTDKKKEKKEKDYYDPVEDVHWTEM